MRDTTTTTRAASPPTTRRPPVIAAATGTSPATASTSSTGPTGWPAPRVVAAQLHPRSAGDGPAPDGDDVRRGHPLSKITTLRPKDYSEARTIGERFRDGTPVIMDLVSMDNADAKRLVDFAAGLAFALRGSFDKVATKVFLLSPADVDVSPEERRRIAETGFYAYQ